MRVQLFENQAAESWPFGTIAEQELGLAPVTRPGQDNNFVAGKAAWLQQKIQGL